MRELNYMSVAEHVIDQIKKGAFLTVKAGDLLNTMAIGWALMGFMWRKPILMLAVRKSRHTFNIIEKALDFTISVPTTDMQGQVMYCGTKSGRDVNKYKECHLELANAQRVSTPIIKTPGIHFECKIIYKAPMDARFLDNEYEALYPKKDYHTLYFGEILACYEDK